MPFGTERLLRFAFGLAIAYPIPKGNYMDTRSNYKQQAAELHNAAAHTHTSAAEQHGKQDHLTGHERSRQALEHSAQVHEKVTAEPRHAHVVKEEDIAALAYRLWLERGRPEGSPEKDWFRAVELLGSRH